MDYCPKCHRTGDDIGDCGNGVMPCPEPRTVDPSLVAVVSCGPCGRTLAFSVGDLMKDGAVRGVSPCKLDTCAATLVTPAAGYAQEDQSPPSPELAAEQEPVPATKPATTKKAPAQKAKATGAE